MCRFFTFRQNLQLFIGDNSGNCGWGADWIKYRIWQGSKSNLKSELWNICQTLPLYQVVSFNLNIIAHHLTGVTNWCEPLSPDCVNHLFRRSFKLDSRGPEWSASAWGWVLSDQNWISDCRMLHTLGYGPCILLGMAPAYLADPTSSDWQVVRTHNTRLHTLYHIYMHDNTMYDTWGTTDAKCGWNVFVSRY